MIVVYNYDPLTPLLIKSTISAPYQIYVIKIRRESIRLLVNRSLIVKVSLEPYILLHDQPT